MDAASTILSAFWEEASKYQPSYEKYRREKNTLDPKKTNGLIVSRRLFPIPTTSCLTGLGGICFTIGDPP